MTLSQEILVLDFGDEKQSDFLKSDASIDFNGAGKIEKKEKDVFKRKAFMMLIVHGIFLSRQNGDHRGAMSNKNLGAGARSNVCPSGAHLYLHDLLLLHEEMADTS